MAKNHKKALVVAEEYFETQKAEVVTTVEGWAVAPVDPRQN